MTSAVKKQDQARGFSSRTARANKFGIHTRGGSDAARWLSVVSRLSDHAVIVAESAPVLFWICYACNVSTDEFAARAERLTSAKAILKECHGLPKAFLRFRAPLPRTGGHQFLLWIRHHVPPQVLASAIPLSLGDQWKWAHVCALAFERMGRHDVPVHLRTDLACYTVRHIDRIRAAGDLGDIVDYLASCETINPNASAQSLRRGSEAWHIEQAEKSVSGSSEKIKATEGWPDAIIAGDCLFTLLESELDLKREGFEMKHCVGSYVGVVHQGRSIIYHATGPDGDRATCEFVADARRPHVRLEQIKGPHNGRVSMPLLFGAQGAENTLTRVLQRQGVEATTL